MFPFLLVGLPFFFPTEVQPPTPSPPRPREAGMSEDAGADPREGADLESPSSPAGEEEESSDDSE